MAIVNCWYCTRSTLRPVDPTSLREWSWVSMAFWHRDYPEVTQTFFCSLDHANKWVQEEMPRVLVTALLDKPKEKGGPYPRGVISSGVFGYSVPTSGGLSSFTPFSRGMDVSAAGQCAQCDQPCDAIAMSCTLHSTQVAWKFCGTKCLEEYRPMTMLEETVRRVSAQRKKLAKRR